MTNDIATHTLAGGIIAIVMFALGFAFGLGLVYTINYIRTSRNNRCNEMGPNYHDGIPPVPRKTRTMWD